MNFYGQRFNLKKLHRAQFTSCTRADNFPTDLGNPLEKRNPDTYIYMKESLTPMNSRLLEEAKRAAKELKYKYSAYTYKGEVRVRKADTSRYIGIRNDNDLDIPYIP